MSIKETNCDCNIGGGVKVFLTTTSNIYCAPLIGLAKFCHNNTILSDRCFCGDFLCSSNQLCNGTLCLNSCPKYDIAPEIGCICGSNNYVCNEGQICKNGHCFYPPPSILFLIIGLFFAFILMFSLLWLLNLLTK